MPKRPPTKATEALLREAARASAENERLGVRFGCGLLLAAPIGFVAATRAGAYAFRHHLDANTWSWFAGLVTAAVVVSVTTFGTDRDLFALLRAHGRRNRVDRDF